MTEAIHQIEDAFADFEKLARCSHDEGDRQQALVYVNHV
jgi:hypothetical protein